MKNNIEGDLNLKDRVFVIEDLISSGNSSLKAVNELKEFGANVLGLEQYLLMDFKNQLIISELNLVNSTLYQTIQF